MFEGGFGLELLDRLVFAGGVSGRHLWIRDINSRRGLSPAAVFVLNVVWLNLSNGLRRECVHRSGSGTAEGEVFRTPEAGNKKSNYSKLLGIPDARGVVFCRQIFLC
jgi:hypothetical protein